ncbi:MAG: TonB-dependent receptor [Bacteroidota bacterium]|nr:TonB-dependent receptor [Bacteroidota bacterium]
MLLKLIPIRLWLITCLFFVSFISIAQQKTVSGKVTDAKNEPVSGASILVKGTNTGTTTDEQGLFTIAVPNDQSVLNISYVGFETKEVRVGSESNLNVSLASSASTLNEVVVTGYTAQARKDISGSVSVVKVGDLKSIPAANAESQLQGRASGVTVTTSGVPGASPTVRIRGFSNFGANSPLYILDGVPIGGIGGLNPNDIESMQVLKDAASASIYGARAAQGVIIITTKRGRQGTAKVSYNSYYGRQDPGKGFTNLLNPQEQADLTFLAYQNSGQTPPVSQYGTGPKPVLPDYILAGAIGGLFEGDPRVNPALYKLNIDDPQSAYLIMKANKAGTNWFDEITENAPIMNHNLSVSGGANKSRYLFSFDYFDQKGILIYNFYERYTARINTEFNIKDNIRIGQNLQVRYTEDNTPGNNNEGTEIAFSYRNQPIIPIYDIMGNFAGTRAPGLGNATNPFATRTRAKDNRGQSMGLFGNMYAEVDFLQHFTARSSFGGQMTGGNYYFFTNRTYENAENNTGNSYAEGFNRFRSWTWTNQLTYKNIFAGIHDVTALVGTEAIEEFGRSIEGRRSAYFLENPDFRSLNNGASGQVATGGPFTPAALFSVFGKVDYSLNDKYLASVTVRRDGSSRFGPENRYGVFPAFSVGWRISKESFMQGIDWISDLKLRGSYGIMGGQRIDPSNAFTQFNQGIGSSFYDINGSSGSSLQTGFQSNFVGNLEGKWEENKTTNIGFDASLFGGKTEFVFDWYKKTTEDLLFQRRGVATGGLAFAAPRTFYNTASMENKGVDIMLSQKANLGASTNRITLDLTGTFTTYNNEITGLAEGNTFYETGGSRINNFVRNAIGQPVGSFYGYQVIGLFQNAADVTSSPAQDGKAIGRFKYLDANRDGKISDSDRVFFGDPNPDFTYGFNVNADYKAFDISFFFYGSKGADAINYTRYFTDFFPSFQGGKSKDLLYNSFSASNTGARTPIAENTSNFSNNGVVNSYYLENASYLRLKNLTIGYSLSPKLLSRVKIDRLRLYVQAANLFTATKYTGLDPEIIGGQDNFGIDAGAYPTVKQFLFGLNVNF